MISSLQLCNRQRDDISQTKQEYLITISATQQLQSWPRPRHCASQYGIPNLAPVASFQKMYSWTMSSCSKRTNLIGKTHSQLLTLLKWPVSHLKLKLQRKGMCVLNSFLVPAFIIACASSWAKLKVGLLRQLCTKSQVWTHGSGWRSLSVVFTTYSLARGRALQKPSTTNPGSQLSWASWGLFLLSQYR